jgi:hypothetical protein
MEAGRPRRALRRSNRPSDEANSCRAWRWLRARLGRVLINAQIAAACATDLHDAQASAVLDHSRTLPQGDGDTGPTLAGIETGPHTIVVRKTIDRDSWLREADCDIR